MIARPDPNPQITPGGDHFYIYGESERLARPVFFIAQRKLHSKEDWGRWFEQITQPEPLTSWDDAFKSQIGLARRHNVHAFLRALYLFVSEYGDEDVQARVHEALLGAISAVPGLLLRAKLLSTRLPHAP